MVRFDPNTLYGKDDLEEMLKGVVEMDTFLKRLGLNGSRVFRDAFWGWEILEASRSAPSFTEKAPGPGVSDVLAERHAGTNEAGAKVARLAVDDVV